MLSKAWSLVSVLRFFFRWTARTGAASLVSPPSLLLCAVKELIVKYVCTRRFIGVRGLFFRFPTFSFRPSLHSCSVIDSGVPPSLSSPLLENGADREKGAPRSTPLPLSKNCIAPSSISISDIVFVVDIPAR